MQEDKVSFLRFRVSRRGLCGREEEVPNVQEVQEELYGKEATFLSLVLISDPFLSFSTFAIDLMHYGKE